MSSKSSKSTKNGTTKAQLAAGLKYNDVVKAQSGMDREAIAKKAVQTTNSKFGGDPNIKAYGEKYTPGSGGFDAPASTPTVNSIDSPLSPALQPPTPTAGTITPEEALAKAKATGVAAPQEPADARQAVSQMMPQPTDTFYKPSADSQQVYDSTGKPLSYDQYIAAGGKSDFSNVQAGVPDTAVTQQIEQDPAYQQLLADRKEYNDVVNQRQSLTQEYSAMSKKLGIDELNTELMNMKNVIEGTEDDLRTEITKAGGFATESQVMALAGARNKQLVKNFNNLLETKQMAMETLNTMIGLASQDRQFAQQAAMQKLQIDQQIIEYKDKMKTNAQTAYQKIIDSIGYAGLAKMTNGDPWSTAMIEKTMGLGAGQLNKLASIPGEVDTQVVTAGGRSLLINTQTGETIKDLGGAYKGGGGGSSSASKAQQKTESENGVYSYLASVAGSDGYVSPEDWQAALDAWIQDGYPVSDFMSNFDQYINPADPQDYQ